MSLGYWHRPYSSNSPIGRSLREIMHSSNFVLGKLIDSYGAGSTSLSKPCQHVAITLSIHSNCFSSLIFEKVCHQSKIHTIQWDATIFRDSHMDFLIPRNDNFVYFRTHPSKNVLFADTLLMAIQHPTYKLATY